MQLAGSVTVTVTYSKQAVFRTPDFLHLTVPLSVHSTAGNQTPLSEVVLTRVGKYRILLCGSKRLSTGPPPLHLCQYSHKHLTIFTLAELIGFVAKKTSSFAAHTCLLFQQHPPPAPTGALREYSKT